MTVFVDTKTSAEETPKFTPLMFVLLGAKLYAVEAICDNREYYVHAEKPGGGWQARGFWVNKLQARPVAWN